MSDQLILCVHCGAAVWWSLSRADDPCYECKKPIGIRTKPKKGGESNGSIRN